MSLTSHSLLATLDGEPGAEATIASLKQHFEAVRQHEVIRRCLRHLHRFHPLRGIPEQPFILDAEIEKAVEPMMLSLHSQRTIFPGRTEVAQVRRG